VRTGGHGAAPSPVMVDLSLYPASVRRQVVVTVTLLEVWPNEVARNRAEIVG
jgi:hypothetical protein